jgi:hypothetical protein
MAQAVNRRPLTAEAQVRARVSLCGICCGKSGTGTGFSQSSSVYPCQYHSTVYLHTHWDTLHCTHCTHLGMNIRPFVGRGSETYSHPIDMNINGMNLRTMLLADIFWVPRTRNRFLTRSILTQDHITQQNTDTFSYHD